MRGAATKTNRLDNATVLARLHALVARDRTTTAKLLWHLAEVDERGLYRDEGYSSLFEYCVKELRMSEGQASVRIRAARLSRRFPVVLSKVERGELHLSALRALSPVLTEANHEALLRAATHKTRREVEQMLADMAPKPDAPSTVRKLPSARSTADQSRTAHSAPTHAAGSRSTGTSEVGPTTHATFSLATPEPCSLNPPAAATRAERRGETTPLGEQGGAQRYRVQFTADQALYDQIRQAQDLLRHRIPDGDLSQIVGKAMTLLVEQVKKQRFGHTKRPQGDKAQDTRRMRPRQKSETGASTKPAGQPASRKPVTASKPTQTADAAPAPSNRHIPAEVRRKVVERDGARCTYVSDSGRRCDATGWLEFHHDDPFARGGPPTVDNVWLMCRSHNALMAERDFGRDFILGIRHGKRVSQRTAPEPSPD